MLLILLLCGLFVVEVESFLIDDEKEIFCAVFEFSFLSKELLEQVVIPRYCFCKVLT